MGGGARHLAEALGSRSVFRLYLDEECTPGAVLVRTESEKERGEIVFGGRQWGCACVHESREWVGGQTGERMGGSFREGSGAVLLETECGSGWGRQTLSRSVGVEISFSPLSRRGVHAWGCACAH